MRRRVGPVAERAPMWSVAKPPALLRIACLLIVAFGLSLASPQRLAAQDPPADATPPSDAAAAARGIPWSELTPQEQDLLAPVHDQWETLPPLQQMRLRRKA